MVHAYTASGAVIAFLALIVTPLLMARSVLRSDDPVRGPPALAAAAFLAVAPPSFSQVKVTSVEGITEYRLANGARVLLYPEQSRPTIGAHTNIAMPDTNMVSPIISAS